MIWPWRGGDLDKCTAHFAALSKLAGDEECARSAVDLGRLVSTCHITLLASLLSLHPTSRYLSSGSLFLFWPVLLLAPLLAGERRQMALCNTIGVRVVLDCSLIGGGEEELCPEVF